jgi:hypothetical protein
MTNCTLFLLGKSKRQHNIYWIYNTTRTSSINKTESEIMFPRRVVISCTHNETKNESEIVFFGKVKCNVAWPANMIQIGSSKWNYNCDKFSHNTCHSFFLNSTMRNFNNRTFGHFRFWFYNYTSYMSYFPLK